MPLPQLRVIRHGDVAHYTLAGRGSNPADLNGDGVVGINDLLILLANWTA